MGNYCDSIISMAKLSFVFDMGAMSRLCQNPHRQCCHLLAELFTRCHSTMPTTKSVTKVVESRWQSEGRGARVRRSIGRPELRNLDPFLMLDEFQVRTENGWNDSDPPHSTMIP